MGRAKAAPRDEALGLPQEMSEIRPLLTDWPGWNTAGGCGSKASSQPHDRRDGLHSHARRKRCSSLPTPTPATWCPTRPKICFLESVRIEELKRRPGKHCAQHGCPGGDGFHQTPRASTTLQLLLVLGGVNADGRNDTRSYCGYSGGHGGAGPAKMSADGGQ